MKNPPFKKLYPSEVEAAADVMREAYDAGSFALDPKETAAKMISAAYDARSKGVILTGLLKDGSPVRIQFVDKGDHVPGYDKLSNRFEALTSWFRFVGPDRHEGYSQVDRIEAEYSGNIDAFRWANDMLVMDGMGVDTASLEVSGQ